MPASPAPVDAAATQSPQRAWLAIAEIALIFLVFFLHGAWPTPDVNEAGYLAKAAHYWDPNTFSTDFFCNTADAHWVYYWSFGWMTKLGLSFDTVAWIGRVVTWLLLAFAWQRLSFAIVPRAWLSIATAQVFVMLTEQIYMAGEWLIGGVEAKGFSWFFVFLALHALVQNRWKAAWLLVGVATSFHVVVGGWAAICLAIVWLASADSRPSLISILPAICGGILLAVPGLCFALRLNAGVDWETAAAANRIQVYDRLPHHLYASEFANGFIARQLLLWAMFFVLAAVVPATESDRRFRRFVFAATIISTLGFALNFLAMFAPDFAAAGLRFYWFRLTDILVPCGVALVGFQCLLSLLANQYRRRCLLIAALTTVCIYDLAVQIRHNAFLPETVRANPRGDKFTSFADWRDVCRWAHDNTPPETVFITPRNASTFKWYAGRNEVANWKDMPQDAASLNEWWLRLRDIFGNEGMTADKHWRLTLAELPLPELQSIGKKYDAGYVIVELLPDVAAPAGEVYKNNSYAVFRVDGR
jgi:hypothetical protein